MVVIEPPARGSQARPGAVMLFQEVGPEAGSGVLDADEEDFGRFHVKLSVRLPLRIDNDLARLHLSDKLHLLRFLP